jgi:predicted nucleotidyltransferase component of viral defense system
VPFEEQYRRQVALLLRTIPLVAVEDCFALKGGTAINLFIRDMPRLSVDIDLTYLPVQPRDQSLKAIGAAMTRISERIVKAIPGARVTPSTAEGAILKLLLRTGGAQIKIEVTPVLRGCVYEPELRAVSSAVEETFGFAEMQVVSFADLYAGKIVAALDRQHPRDLFDVRDLLAKEGIGDDLRRAFIVYLLSHGRPMSEVLAPRRKLIREEFLRGFAGMTEKPVAVDDLVAVREEIIQVMVGGMSKDHRAFLMSFKSGKPEWLLLGAPEAASLPAVKWRQQNLIKLSRQKRDGLVKRLQEVLGE